MTGPGKRKGDRGERDVAAIIAALTGHTVRRMLGAGRADDVGDIDGVPDTVVQVAAWKDVLRAVWEKPLGAEDQRANAGAGYAATFVKLPRRGWRVVMTPEQWAAYHASTLAPVVAQPNSVTARSVTDSPERVQPTPWWYSGGGA